MIKKGTNNRSLVESVHLQRTNNAQQPNQGSSLDLQAFDSNTLLMSQ
jgi:hypothetical protein